MGKKWKVTVGMTNYSGEMMGTIFKDSVAIIEEREDEMRFAQHRLMERLKLLIPGTTVEEVGAESPESAGDQPHAEAPAPEPAPAIEFADDEEEIEDEPEEAEPAKE